MTDKLQPRWLSPEQAAAYLSVRVDELPRLRRQGMLPEPSRYLGPRKPRYDRLALDAMFVKGPGNSTEQAADAAIQAILAETPRRQKAAR